MDRPGETARGIHGMLQLATEGNADEVVRVLLIEDDEADALLVREYLHDAGLGVSLCWQQSLAAATPELQAGPVCVLLDLGLPRSEEHTSELQSPCNLVCRL